MKKLFAAALIVAFSQLAWLSPAIAADPLESGFINPPAQAAPWCYHYPALPPGRDFDCTNSDVIIDRLTVNDGSHVLPKQDNMRPAVLRKIRDVIQAGATVLGPPPLASPVC